VSQTSSAVRAGSLALVFSVLLAGGAGAAGQVGDIAPGFTLQSTTGQTHSLADHNGKVRFLFMLGYG